MYWISNNELMHTHISGMAAMGQEIWKRWLSITSNFANFGLKAARHLHTRSNTSSFTRCHPETSTVKWSSTSGPRLALALALVGVICYISASDMCQ